MAQPFLNSQTEAYELIIEKVPLVPLPTFLPVALLRMTLTLHFVLGAGTSGVSQE